MKPFDASLNALIDAGPADWVRFLAPRVGLTPGPAEPVDTDLLVAGQRFGVPPPAVEAAVQSEGDADRLRRMLGRLLDATGWDDLLATP